MKIIAYHTPDYEEEARPLRESCRRLGLDVEIHRADSLGDWHDNTRHKASVLCMARQALDGPLLYVDVDAWLHHDPRGFEFPADADIACHFRVWSKWPDGQLLTGTLWINDTPNAERLLAAWAAENQRRLVQGEREGGGQTNLQRVLESMPEIRVHKLGPEWCMIHDLHRRDGFTGEPIIEHLLASRVHRFGMDRDVKKERRLAELIGGAA